VATELLMRFAIGTQAIDGESQADVATDDTLMTDFVPGKFSDIEDFSLGMDLDEKTSAPLTLSPGPSVPPGARSLAPPIPPTSAHSRTRFAQWLDGMKAKDAYAVNFEPFSFTKQFDKASPTLFEMCCNSKSFGSISLVKRKLIGANDREVDTYAYVRINFVDALIIGLDWDVGESVKEKCKFIARRVMIKYRQQLPDGTLGAQIPGEWKRDMQVVKQ
jgi:type VI protein secretion system component Hcp